MHGDVMWAAGFYEGEGSLCGSNSKLQMVVPQVNREPLDRFQAVFGGAGRITLDSKRGIHLYRASGLTAQRVAMQMYPALSGRRRAQILDALTHFSFRRVRDPLRCRRGHRYTEAGVYRNRRGRECEICRETRKGGQKLPMPLLPTAYSIRLGMREYVPPDMKSPAAAVAWTFDLAAKDYAPLVET